MPKANSLAQRITEARQKMGMSKSALAKAVGVTPAAVGAWEEGRAAPRAPMLSAIADVINLQPVAPVRAAAAPPSKPSPGPTPRPLLMTPLRTSDQILTDARTQLAALWKIDAAKVVVTATVSTG